MTLRASVDQREILIPNVSKCQNCHYTSGKKQRLLRSDKVYLLKIRNEYLLSDFHWRLQPFIEHWLEV